MDDAAEEVELLEAEPLEILARQHHSFALGVSAFLNPVHEFDGSGGGVAQGGGDGGGGGDHGVLAGIVVGCEADLAKGGGGEGEGALRGGGGGGAAGAGGVVLGFVVIRGEGRGKTVIGVGCGEWCVWRKCRQQHLIR